MSDELRQRAEAAEADLVLEYDRRQAAEARVAELEHDRDVLEKCRVMHVRAINRHFTRRTALEADLRTNAAMLARQCDMAREAETRAAEMEARIEDVRQAHQEWLDLPEQFPTEEMLEALSRLYGEGSPAEVVRVTVTKGLALKIADEIVGVLYQDHKRLHHGEPGVLLLVKLGGDS